MGEFTDICDRKGHNESTAGAGMRLETSENQLGIDEGCFDTGIYFLAVKYEKKLIKSSSSFCLKDMSYVGF